MSNPYRDAGVVERDIKPGEWRCTKCRRVLDAMSNARSDSRGGYLCIPCYFGDAK